MYDGGEPELKRTVGYLEPSEDFIASAKLGEGALGVVSNDIVSKINFIDNANARTYGSSHYSYDDVIAKEKKYLEENKEELSEYLSICWYMEKIESRIKDISNTLTVLEREHIDIDTTEIRLKIGSLNIQLDNLKRRQFVIASTRPDVVDYASKTSSLNLQAVDLYPYEKLSAYAKSLRIPLDMFTRDTGLSKYFFGQGTTAVEQSYSSSNYIKKNLKFYPNGHRDDPGPEGRMGISGSPGIPGVYIPQRFL